MPFDLPPRRRPRVPCLVVAILCLAVSSTPAQQTPPPLYSDLGTYHKAVGTQVEAAQQYFDQGLRLVYGFNHAEAIRSFARAAELDTTCAMCYWGIAYAYGPHVNAGMDSAAGVAAYEAAQHALGLSAGAPPWEQAYITAVAARYAENPPAQRAALDSAYAYGMAGVSRQYPSDLDAAALYAESLMDLRPWDYWARDGKPYPGTDEIVRQLQSVLQRDPEHPGACHYYIHAVEAVNPRLALPCAERLARLMPGAGHMVHMPAHIYIRVGRYADAVESNVHAIHDDETFIEGQHPTSVYSLAYYPHNIHFLAFASTMAGRSKQALAAAAELKSKVSLDVARQVPELQAMIPYHALTLVTFGRWDEVIAEPLPPSDMRMPIAMAYYARGVAYAAKGQRSDAARALDTVRTIAAATPDSASAKLPVSIAVHALMGEILTRGGKPKEGVEEFRKAVAIEDSSSYFEPPRWYYPIRHSLGAALLKAGRGAEAEIVYREDLERFPENGWALFGLGMALRSQGRSAEAEDVERRFAQAWVGADVTLRASRF